MQIESKNLNPDEEVKRITEILKKTTCGTNITEDEVEEFIRKKGIFNIVTEGTSKLPLSRTATYITGCSAGVNRSQCVRAWLEQNGIRVKAVIAGTNSYLNPEIKIGMGLIHTTLYRSENPKKEEKAFKKIYGIDKTPVLGSEAEYINSEDLSSEDLQNSAHPLSQTEAARNFYKNFFKELENAHFITFSDSGASVLKRLLETEKDSLENFTITYLPWLDEIQKPSYNSDDSKVAAHSEAAYQKFKQKLENTFELID